MLKLYQKRKGKKEHIIYNYLCASQGELRDIGPRQKSWKA